MIRRLRRRHRRVLVVLAVLVPVGLAIALASRLDDPVMTAIPETLTGPEPNGTPIGELQAAIDGTDIVVRRWSEDMIELRPAADLRRPDVLVAWNPGHGAAFPATDAVLLGTLRGAERRVFPLSTAVRAGDGELVLFSLGHGEELGRTSLPGGDAP